MVMLVMYGDLNNFLGGTNGSVEQETRTRSTLHTCLAWVSSRPATTSLHVCSLCHPFTHDNLVLMYRIAPILKEIPESSTTVQSKREAYSDDLAHPYSNATLQHLYWWDPENGYSDIVSFICLRSKK